MAIVTAAVANRFLLHAQSGDNDYSNRKSVGHADVIADNVMKQVAQEMGYVLVHSHTGRGRGRRGGITNVSLINVPR